MTQIDIMDSDVINAVFRDLRVGLGLPSAGCSAALQHLVRAAYCTLMTEQAILFDHFDHSFFKEVTP